MPGLKQLITRLSLLSGRPMASGTYKICLIWCTLYALIYAFHFLTESLMPLNLDKHWGCGGFQPTITPEEPVFMNFYFGFYFFLFLSINSTETPDMVIASSLLIPIDTHLLYTSIKASEKPSSSSV